MPNMKEWTQNRAEEIALEAYRREFYDLGPHIQLLVYAKAMEDYRDYYADLIDSTYERLRDQKLFGLTT